MIACKFSIQKAFRNKSLFHKRTPILILGKNEHSLQENMDKNDHILVALDYIRFLIRIIEDGVVGSLP
jgi:hypothetical protein